MRIKDKARKVDRILRAASTVIGRALVTVLVRIKQAAVAFFQWWKVQKGDPFYGLKRLFRFACAAGVVVVGMCVAASIGLHHQYSDRLFASAKEVPPKFTAIVLGAAVYSGGRPSPILEDRLLAAEKLYRLHKVRKILLSGDHGKKRYDETTAMHRFLQKRRIPEKDIFLDHAGFRTLDTMFRAALVFGVKDAVICTQRFHLSRSLFLAEKAGIDAVGFVSDRRRYRHHFINFGREILASFTALIDVYVIEREPRFLGDPISIENDGEVTRK